MPDRTERRSRLADCGLPIAGVVLCLALCIAQAGCSVIGVAAHAMPPPTIDASYKGLEGQSVAVMVWADRALRLDYPSLQLDTAATIQKTLQSSKALKNVSWPLDPRSIVRYQLDHPEVETMPINDIAPRLGVSRLIYVEVERFSTRAGASVSLYRGAMMASVKVVEVSGDGKAKVGFEENSIEAVFPPHVPPEGYPKGDDYQFYLGTISAFGDEVAKRFVPHQEEE